MAGRDRLVRDDLDLGDDPKKDGLEAAGTVQLTVTRLVVREARHAIRLTGRNRNVVIAHCHLYHNRGAGVFYDAVNLHQSNIVGCHISYNARAALYRGPVMFATSRSPGPTSRATRVRTPRRRPTS